MRVAIFLLLVALAVVGADAGRTRRYYISADEVEWDYCPNGPRDGQTNSNLLDAGPLRLGSSYRKAIYREYTDSTFSNLAVRSRDDEHLGILGPTLYAEVGDVFEIHFRNAASFNFSVHPHSVLYTKDAEGARYKDGTTVGDVIPPGNTYTYVWPVPARAGPGPGDVSSRCWMYHGHVDEPVDTNAGIVGFMVVTKHGHAWPDGKPKDVDREIFVLADTFDENASPYVGENVGRLFANSTTVEGLTQAELMADPGFQASNQFHSINGYVFANVPGMYMNQGDHVRWYLAALGTFNDVMNVVWRGNTVVDDNKARVTSTSLIAGITKEVDMIPTRAGIWSVMSSVTLQLSGGMSASYTVNVNDLDNSYNYATTADPFEPAAGPDDDDTASLVTTSVAMRNVLAPAALLAALFTML